jgi:hypothetical protein
MNQRPQNSGCGRVAAVLIHSELRQAIKVEFNTVAVPIRRHGVPLVNLKIMRHKAFQAERMDLEISGIGAGGQQMEMQLMGAVGD